MGYARVGSNPAHSDGGLAQMVERSLCMREAGGSMPPFSISTFGVVVTYFPSKEVPRFRLPEGAISYIENPFFSFLICFIPSQFLTETHCTGFFILIPNCSIKKIIMDSAANFMDEAVTFSKFNSTSVPGT